MEIGLVSYRSKNKDVAYNMRQIERAMREAQGKAELLCFGEAFVQGFDSLSWDFETDKEIALDRGSETIETLCRWTKTYNVALLTGYIEREDDRIYSSCIVIEDGRILHNYRRISAGWKEIGIADAHYREGDETGEFQFRGRLFMPALCGDLWEYTERFKTENVLIWPVYVSIPQDLWEQGQLLEYAQQAALAAHETLMINSIDPDNDNVGGAFRSRDGEIVEGIPFGKEGILFTNLSNPEDNTL